MAAVAERVASIEDAAEFINIATAEQLERLDQQMRLRRRTLESQRALSVTTGTQATLTNLSPKYLNGLTGTVTSISGSRATVTLDEGSTISLRYAGRKFYVAPGVTNYPATGVPLACIEVGSGPTSRHR